LVQNATASSVISIIILATSFPLMMYWLGWIIREEWRNRDNDY